MPYNTNSLNNLSAKHTPLVAESNQGSFVTIIGGKP